MSTPTLVKCECGGNARFVWPSGFPHNEGFNPLIGVECHSCGKMEPYVKIMNNEFYLPAELERATYNVASELWNAHNSKRPVEWWVHSA